MPSTPGILAMGDGRLDEIIYYMGPASQQGSATISGLDVTSAVTLAQVQPNATYLVFTGVVATSGAPAIGSKSSFVTSRATTGFTLNVDVAPGVGTSVTVAWVLFPSAV